MKVGHIQQNVYHGNSLAIQWLGLRAFTAEGPGPIPGWGTKIPQAARRGQKTCITSIMRLSVRHFLYASGSLSLSLREGFKDDSLIFHSFIHSFIHSFNTFVLTVILLPKL